MLRLVPDLWAGWKLKKRCITWELGKLDFSNQLTQCNFTHLHVYNKKNKKIAQVKTGLVETVSCGVLCCWHVIRKAI